MAGWLVAAAAGISIRLRPGVPGDRAAGGLLGDAERAQRRGRSGATARGSAAYAADGGALAAAAAIGQRAAEGRGLEQSHDAARSAGALGAAAYGELRPERERAAGGAGRAASVGEQRYGAARPGGIARPADVADGADCADRPAGGDSREGGRRGAEGSDAGDGTESRGARARAVGIGANAMKAARTVRMVGVMFAGLGLVTLGADEDFGVEEREIIERTFPAANSIDIDNADGSITVAGTDAREIKVEIHKTIRARSAEKVQEAKREVRLDMTEQGDGLRLYVDGPFRCKCGDGSFNYRGSHYY